VKSVAFALSAFCMTVLAPSAANASEIFGGAYVHDVDTFLSISGIEDGADLQLGWRGDRIGPTPLQPFAYVSAHTKGDTHFAAAGLSAKFGDSLFVRPGVGLAMHTGCNDDFQRTDCVAFGSRVLFAPELGIGAQINDRMSLEASWVHYSHGQLFGRQNPGMDNIGVRLTLDLP
jgi:lipid A 3-O-deacylase